MLYRWLVLVCVFIISPISQACPCMGLPKLSADQISPNALRQAMNKGAFYLEIPDELKPFVKSGVSLSNRFYQDDTLKQFREGDFGGYHQRENDQIESFYVEKSHWNKVLNEEQQVLAKGMNGLAVKILKQSLKAARVDGAKWAAVTGGLTENQGQHHFSANHYRSEMDSRGINSHKIFGFVTVQYPEQKGLEAFIDYQWVDVPAIKDHFVVFYGKAFETLIANEQILSAALHRVNQQSSDETSFAVSIDGNIDSKLYAYDGKEFNVAYNNYHEYLNNSFRETYAP